MFGKRLHAAFCGFLLLFLPSLSIGEAVLLQDEPTAKTRPLGPADAHVRAKWTRACAGLPLFFEANQGQTDPSVRYLSRGPGHTLFFTPEETVAALGAPDHGDRNTRSTEVVRIRYVGADTNPSMKGLEPLGSSVHYVLGNDPGMWRTGVPLYGKIEYAGLYSGIDLVYYGSQGRLEYDFRVAPFADPGVVQLGIRGADGVEIDSEGRLVIRLQGGTLVQEAPCIYQISGDVKTRIDGGYEIRTAGTSEDASEVIVGFRTVAYDSSRTLVIDPVLSYSTYLGGSANSPEAAYGIAVDGSGCAYVTGKTASADFPTQDPLQAAPAGGGDVFVTKFDATGSSLVYSTYLGGSGTDVGYGIAVDASGCAHVTGSTDSADFPLSAGPFQTDQGGTDAFVTKLDTTGSSLVYSTYLGGGGTDAGYGIALDDSGNAYVTGETGSADFPTLSPIQTDQGGTDAFVAKVDAAGSALVYSTYLGGAGTDIGRGIAVDGSGNAYVTGETASNDFPTQTPFQATQGSGDAFVTKLQASGLGLVYSTFLGGSFAVDVGYGIAVDDSGHAYVTGKTDSTVFNVSSSPYQTDQGGTDAFAAKFDPTGSSLVYSTYLGGAGTDAGRGIAADASGNAYVTGETGSADFPTAGLIQTALDGTKDAFVTKFDPSGFTLVYSTYLGGSVLEVGYGVAVDSQGNAYVAGETTSDDFPTRGPFQAALGNALGDAFVARIGVADIALSPTTIAFGRLDPGASSSPVGVTVTNNGLEALSLGQIAVTGADAAHFRIQGDSCTNQDLAPGASCGFQVVYAPLAEGNKTAAVAVPSNDPDTPTESVTLSSHPLGITIYSTNADVSDVAVSDTGDGEPSGMDVQEAVRFTLSNVQGTADVVMVFATLPEDPVFWKVVNGVWTEFYPRNKTQGITNVSLTGNTLIFTIADNSDCDADDTIGVIGDPVVVGSEAGANDTSGGCFLSALR